MSIETLIYALLGWLVGVLINYAADTLPHHGRLGEYPHCPACGAPRPPFAWSAIVGYLTGRRLCLGCGMPLALRSVVVEVVTPAVFVGLLWRYGPSVHLGFLTLYSVVLILVTVTDLEHHLILSVVMVPALLLAMVGAFFDADMTARRAFLGGAFGLVVLYAMFLLAQPVSAMLGRLFGREVTETPFGFGDVMLGTFVGLITGLPGVIMALFLTVLSAGLVAAVYWFILAVVQRRYTLFTAMPYGPFLVLGGFVMMVYGPQILTWYITR